MPISISNAPNFTGFRNHGSKRRRTTTGPGRSCRDCRPYISAGPGGPAVHLGRARMLLPRPRFSEAKAAADKFLAAHPDNVEAIVTLGKIESGRGQFLVAAGHHARAIALSPRPEPEYYAERAA